MPTIVRLTPIESIKPSTGGVAPDGTIRNPLPYSAVDVEFDDGVTVQVERPLTQGKIQAALAALAARQPAIDGFNVGDNVP